MLEVIVLLVYASFFVDFLIWPIPSEVATLEILKQRRVVVDQKIMYILCCQLIIAILWAIPAIVWVQAVLGDGYAGQNSLLWVGAVLAVVGRTITLTASHTIRRYGVDRVVTTSIFSVSRHPIVLGLHLALGGLLIMVQWWMLLLPYSLSLYYFDYKVKQEEKMLYKKHGNDYKAYADITPRYLLWSAPVSNRRSS